MNSLTFRQVEFNYKADLKQPRAECKKTLAKSRWGSNVQSVQNIFNM